MARVWGTLRSREKILFEAVVQMEQPCLDDAVDMLCRALDIPRPVALRKHRHEFQQFRHTRFSQADFIEKVGFTFFELEELRERKRNDADPSASNPVD